MTWWMVDLLIMLAYGLQHTVLTTKVLVRGYNAILPAWSWNISYSIMSVITLLLAFHFWAPSGVYIFYLTPGSIPFHLMTISLAASLFFFFFCFKYTTSFWQWLGVRQVAARLKNEQMPAYYRVRQQGIKKYIRFPHHTCLILLFWTHPVMTLDTLFLAIGATIYLYLGTYHQDLRGLAMIGESWQQYRNDTALLIPTPKVLKRMYRDFTGKGDSEIEAKAAQQNTAPTDQPIAVETN
ncbi:hypothetical protein [Pseudomonas brassicacearum]|uniref:hypothetical protein n=1 Tax=Pseudomonas brassicacearum TaxID=930166 RepID=UPI001DB76A59|nr:hypothetical protein [Pseudomonas brassicacearum]CAH0131473.1 hypothetical protein SRABI06_00242 [Pseudomonas brassicacearum]